jgi:prevent-host-death family protein
MYNCGMTSEIPVTEARAQLSDLINRVGYGGERIVLTRHGKPLVALVPAADLEADRVRAEEPIVLLDLSSQPSGSRSTYTVAAEDPSHPIA